MTLQQLHQVITIADSGSLNEAAKETVHISAEFVSNGEGAGTGDWL